MKKLQIRVVPYSGQFHLELIVDDGLNHAVMTSVAGYDTREIAEHEAVAARSRLGINRIYEMVFPGASTPTVEFEAENMGAALRFVADACGDDAVTVVKVVDVTK